MLALRILITLFSIVGTFLMVITALLVTYWSLTVILPTIGQVWTGIFSFIAGYFAIYYGVKTYNKMEN